MLHNSWARELRGFTLWAAALALALGCGKDKLGSTLSDLEVSSQRLDWGVVALGSSPRQVLTLRNVGRTSVELSALTVTGPFSMPELPRGGLVLETGEIRSVPVAFTPPAEGHFDGVLRIQADADSGEASVTLAGDAILPKVSLDRLALDFGQVRLGASRELSLTAANATVLPAPIGLRLEGVDAALFRSSLIGPTPAVAPANSSYSIPISFTPDHLGSAEATLVVTPCAGCAELRVALTGTGVASCIGFSPAAVDFGNLAVGAKANRTLTVTNDGNAPVDLVEVFLSANSSRDFSFKGFTPGQKVTLPAGGSLPVTVTFAPSGNGTRSGALRAHAGTPADPCWAEAKLAGSAGSGCLEVQPASLDFGTVAVGMSNRRSVYVANTGCGHDVYLESASASGAKQLTAQALKPTPVLLRQGDVVQVTATFAPDQAGTFTGQIDLAAADDQHQPLSPPASPVPLKGQAKVLPPCTISVSPPRLDFGAVNLHTTTMLAFRIVNTGTNECYLANLGLAAGSSPTFRISGASAGFSLPAGWSYDVKVRFSPDAAGSYQGSLDFTVSDPATPQRSYPITGTGVDGCLAIVPSDLDFGLVKVGCPGPVRSSTVTNNCAGDVRLASAAIAAGGSPAFSLLAPTSFPLSLPAGQSTQVQLRYTPTRSGLDSAAVFLDDGSLNHLLSVHGVGSTAATRTDGFDEPTTQKVDVLFVVDNSGSMSIYQAALTANLDAFLKYALAQNIDFHIGVTTTGQSPIVGSGISCPGGADGGEAGRLFPVDNSVPRILTPQTPNPQQIWSVMINVGVCHWLEQGMIGAYDALTPPLVDHADDPRTPIPNDGNLGFLRPDAKLALIFISDSDDQSDGTVDFYAQFFASLKPNPGMVNVSAVVSPSTTVCPSAEGPGPRYIDLAQRFNGVVEAICTPDWTASLQRVGSSVFGQQNIFPLSGWPADPSQISVVVNGAAVPAGAGWHYDPATNSVVFDPQSTPGAGSHIDISYPLGCGP